MTSPEKFNQPQRERSQYDALLGPFYRYNDLSRDVMSQDGLIALETEDNQLVCPSFQFDTDENNELILNPDIKDAWVLFLDLYHRQLNEDLWNISLRLVMPRQALDNKNIIEAVKDPASKEIALMAIIDEAIRVANWDGVPLSLPQDYRQ